MIFYARNSFPYLSTAEQQFVIWPPYSPTNLRAVGGATMSVPVSSRAVFFL